MAKETPSSDAEEWPVIFRYSAVDAVRDGIFIHVGRVGKENVYFTRSLFDEGYEDEKKRIDVVLRGLNMLTEQDLEDTRYMQLRVIEKDRIWVVRTGEGITYMLPSDY